MRRSLRLNSWANLLALLSSVAVFATGLILLARFHVGAGALRLEWLGLSRLIWVNMHRIPAVLFLAVVIVHVVLHWRPIVLRLQRLWPARTGRITRWDAVLYLGFSVVALTGLAAWTLVPGSPPLSGPAIPTVLLPLRHRCIDIHNLAGVALLVAAAVHIHRHWNWFRTTLKSLRISQASG